jgi:hypothetical protein
MGDTVLGIQAAGSLPTGPNLPVAMQDWTASRAQTCRVIKKLVHGGKFRRLLQAYLPNRPLLSAAMQDWTASRTQHPRRIVPR